MINADNIPARDRLFKIAYGSEAHPEEIEKMALALLALMDAAPVAWQWLYYKQWHVTNDEERARDVVWEGKVEVQPLYTGAMLQHQPQNTPQNIPEIITRWIPVSERMPEREYVLAADFSGKHYSPCQPNTQVGIYADWFDDGNPTWDDGDGNDLHLKQVTHWMPLPAAPQEVNHG